MSTNRQTLVLVLTRPLGFPQCFQQFGQKKTLILEHKEAKNSSLSLEQGFPRVFPGQILPSHSQAPQVKPKEVQLSMRALLR
jgi:hypothetical protein